jgi:hypothetical protein
VQVVYRSVGCHCSSWLGEGTRWVCNETSVSHSVGLPAPGGGTCMA